MKQFRTSFYSLFSFFLVILFFLFLLFPLFSFFLFEVGALYTQRVGGTPPSAPLGYGAARTAYIFLDANKRFNKLDCKLLYVFKKNCFIKFPPLYITYCQKNSLPPQYFREVGAAVYIYIYILHNK